MDDLLNSEPEILEAYSKDASLFKIRPKFVASPKNTEDIKRLVRFANEKRESLTVRAGGSDMTGGPLTESIVVGVANLNKIGEIHRQDLWEIGLACVSVQPGVYYRDFEKETLKHDLLLPCYPASKDIAAIGGMVGNNCGGERSLRYGKMEDSIVSSKWVFNDENEYEIKPIPLAKISSATRYEREIFKLIEDNRELIERSKPKVSKNSSGYFLWNVIKGDLFDLNKLLVGSQGTLGIMTEATLKLVPIKKYHDMVALFFKSWDELPKVTKAIIPLKPESLETFDKETLKLGIRFMPEIAKKAGEGLFSFVSKFLPEALIGARMLGLPELVTLVEIAEESEEEVGRKVEAVREAVKPFGTLYRVIEKDSEEEKFWIMRRESFNLLRKKMGGKRTVPLVDDFCIPVETMAEFLPKAKKILEAYGVTANIAGHAGDGNFHIIPLMDLKKESERRKLIPMAKSFYDLVAEYKGTISGEHNDGIVRTPFLDKMYSPEILKLFKKTKQIFDPKNIFNPKKKVGATLDDFQKYLDRN